MKCIYNITPFKENHKIKRVTVNVGRKINIMIQTKKDSGTPVSCLEYDIKESMRRLKSPTNTGS